MQFHISYFEDELSKLSVDELWSIIEEMIAPHQNPFDKNAMSYEDVLTLCVVLKSSDEVFRNLKQIDILRRELGSTR